MLYRLHNGVPQYFICHPGSPYGLGTDKDKWPRKSGTIIEIPEVDRGEFVSAKTARLTKGQKEMIDLLAELLGVKKDENSF